MCIVQNEQKVEPKPPTVMPKPSLRKEDMVDRRGLEELIKFINGAEDALGMGGQMNHKASAKLAKRQRQKQRKVNT